MPHNSNGPQNNMPLKHTIIILIIINREAKNLVIGTWRPESYSGQVPRDDFPSQCLDIPILHFFMIHRIEKTRQLCWRGSLWLQRMMMIKMHGGQVIVGWCQIWRRMVIIGRWWALRLRHRHRSKPLQCSKTGLNVRQLCLQIHYLQIHSKINYHFIVKCMQLLLCLAPYPP